MSADGKGCLADVLRLRAYDSVIVAYCKDGAISVKQQTVADGLKELYAILGNQAELTVYICSK